MGGAHRFAQVLLVGLVLASGETIFAVAHDVQFSQDGIGAPCLFLGAQLLALVSSFVLASLLLLVSEGKCISYMMVSDDIWRMLRMLGPFFPA